MRTRATRFHGALLAVLLAGPGGAHAEERDRPDEPSRHLHVVFKPRRRCVLSAELAGTVKAVHYEIGQRFQAGEPLVALADAEYQASRDKAAARLRGVQLERQLLDEAVPQANLAKAQARRESARARRETQESLYKDKAVPRSDVEEARAAVKVAEADVAIARAQIAAHEVRKAKADAAAAMAGADLALAETRLAACTVQAPYAGRIVECFVEEHERVGAGDKLVELLDESVLRAQFFVPSSLARSVRPGMRVPIAVRETGTTVDATVSRVSPEINPVTKTLKVFADVENPPAEDERLQSGMRGLLDRACFEGDRRTE